MQEQPLFRKNASAQDRSARNGAYEHMLLVSILLFSSSLRLIAEACNRSALDLTSMGNRKIRAGLEQLAKTIELCSNSLERLPPPPPGAEEADRCFRSFGAIADDYAAALERLVNAAQSTERASAREDLQQVSASVKASFREVVVAFERVFPGQLRLDGEQFRNQDAEE